MRYIYILFFIIGCISFGTSQKKEYNIDDFYMHKNELGINFTNVLGNVLSLNPNNASSPYGLTYRRHYNKWTLRTALNIDINNLNEDDFENGSFINRKLNTIGLNTRLGAEKHIVLSKKMMFSFGLDALLGIDKEHSEINDFNFGNTSFISDQYTYGFGAGPVVRLEFKISDRLFLSTESSMYGYYSIATESLAINGVSSDEPKKTNSKLTLELPQSLFFNIAF
jgi:hypothetical protein